jgi:acyl-CoA thioesterase-2
VTDLAGLLAVLDLERSGVHQFRATHLDEGHGVVFGGQLLAQTVVAATRTMPDKELLSLHTVFARGGTFDEPLTIDVDVMASGRSMASLTVTTT